MFDQTPDPDVGVPSLFFVDQGCIENGVQKNPYHCIVAQALTKSGLDSVSVSLKGIVSFNHEGKRHVGVSDELIEKIMDFDNGKKMEPFIFHVEYVKAFDTEDSEWEREYFDFKTDLSDKRHALYEALRK